MKDQKKRGILKRLFGQNSCCCSFQLETNEKEEHKVSDKKNGILQLSCCSPKTTSDDSTLKKTRDMEE